MTEQTGQPQYIIASIFERAVAFILDFLLFFSAAFWSLYFLISFADWMPADSQTRAWFGGFFAAFIIYAALFNSGGRNTLGKFLIGIKAVDKNTLEPLGFAQSFIRALGYIVGLVTLFAGFALALLNKNRRAVEDLMAGSVVISTREKTGAETAVISTLGTVLIGLLVFYVYYIIFVAPSVFDTARIEAADRQLVRISLVQIQHKRYFGAYTDDIVRLGLISGDPVAFQREIQRNLKRRGFGMGVGKDGFSIVARAKDSKETEVRLVYPSE